MMNYLRKHKVGTVILVIFGWFSISYSAVGKNADFNNLIKSNNILLDAKISLYLEVLKNSQSSDVVERQIKLNITDEIDNIERWLEIDLSKVMEDNARTAKIWESERKGRLDGLLQEMRSALQGAHMDLPNSSTMAHRLLIVRHQIIMFNKIFVASPFEETKEK